MPLTTDQQELFDLMSDTSESAYFAGWMAGTEYRLWTFVVDPADDGRWGNLMLAAPLREQLATLAERIGGWMSYASGDDLPREQWGATYVAAADWSVMYESEMARVAPLRKIAASLPRRYLSYPEAFELIRAGKSED